jgi:lipopolysaccharide export LptBFGC system permease protein LptF
VRAPPAIEKRAELMRRIDRYVLREIASAFAASVIVLVMVSVSGIVAELLS